MMEMQTKTANKISFFVPGTPLAGGSKTGFRTKSGKIIMRDANKKVEIWKSTVAYFAAEAYGGEPLSGPVRCEIVFVLKRPKNHYGTGRNTGILKSTAPYWHTSKPDRTKLMRSTEDALKGILLKDDSHVCDGNVRKIYGEKTGAQITVTSLEEQKELFS